MTTLEQPNPELARAAIKDIATTLDADSARRVVDFYYAVQDYRIQALGQARAVAQGADDGVASLAEHMGASMQRLEEDIRVALLAYAQAHTAGEWAMSITGVGPVIAAGLLAHIDIHQAPTVGHIWRFAGLDPTVTWGKGEKRPWNAKLKVLCWKAGDSFVKQKGRDSDIYGHVYAARKAQEVERNLTGVFAEQAVATMESKNIKDGATRAWYTGQLTVESAIRILEAAAVSRDALTKKLAGEEGSGVPMLPPGRIDLRARRYAVKLFLSHFHHVLYESTFEELPPKPYVIQHGGHVDFIAPPNWVDRKVVVPKKATASE